MGKLDDLFYAAYNKGREAFESCSGGANSNPYPHDSPLYNAWSDGFFDAVAAQYPIDDPCSD